ncbi:MAG: GIY-YIG nuclease family protein [Bacteroidetes bacterium]|nr:GIY-YIG nuclease family protein [Bacteroidota bacterium]MCB9226558.1 GIY-YIG nuclease family protein [Chitinophagales bacterium]
MERGGYIYIMTNKNNTTLYVGVTSNLWNRINEHKLILFPSSFTARYKLFKLVYFESFTSIEEAIYREKQIKAGSRKKKIALIVSLNPQWEDLSSKIEDYN